MDEVHQLRLLVGFLNLLLAYDMLAMYGGPPKVRAFKFISIILWVGLAIYWAIRAFQ